MTVEATWEGEDDFDEPCAVCEQPATIRATLSREEVVLVVMYVCEDHFRFDLDGDTGRMIIGNDTIRFGERDEPA